MKKLKRQQVNASKDKLADMLLNGHKITITDLEAEGESSSKKVCEIRRQVSERSISENQDFLKAASTNKGEIKQDLRILSGE